MTLSALQVFAIAGCVMLGTMITRFLPFLIFPDKKEPPEIIRYLSRCLPAAVMGLLVVYCLKEPNISAPYYALPEILAILLIIILHTWKRNVLLSILAGTLAYKALYQGMGYFFG